MAEGIASLFARPLEFLRENYLPHRVWQEGRETRALDEQIAEAGLPAVEFSEEQIRAMGYEDPIAFREARLASGRQWNVEEEMQIAEQLGPIGQNYIDMSRVSYEPVSSTALGTYYPSQDRIKMFGMDNPLPLDTLAHEFTHRAHARDWGNAFFTSQGSEKAGALEQKLLDSFPEKPRGPRANSRTELLTRFLGAWRADSPDEWEKAVRLWNLVYPVWPKRRRSDQLEQLLDQNRETLLALEVEAMEQQHLRTLATFEERGLPYTRSTPEELSELRARDLENLANSADSRAAGRRGFTIKQKRISDISRGLIENVYIENSGRRTR